MTIGLMVFDSVDRQIVVSMFPFMKAEWNLSDKELGLLVSVISITVAVFSVPAAWIADRFSRVKTIVVMASVWSIACMFTGNYAELLVARGAIGIGEAGYGAAGAAMVATHFPQRMRVRCWAALSHRPPPVLYLASFSAVISRHAGVGRRRSASLECPA